MNLGISGKLALVTGAGRGLGKSISACLAKEGVRVLVTSRSEKDLVELVSTIGGSANGHDLLPLDITLKNGPQQLLDWILPRFGCPDIIVHNVGGNLDITDPLCSLDDWRQVFRINIEIPVEVNRVLVPLMQKARWGRICHVSSISALENQGPPSYCAAKAALTAYVRSLGRYVCKDNVILSSVLPGAVYTDGGYWDKASREKPAHVERYLSERMAIQRFGRPEEVGEVVAFLCSEQSSFCAGSALLVDGGQGRVFFAQE